MKQQITGAYTSSPFGTDYIGGIGTGMSSSASAFGDLLGAEVVMPVAGTIRHFRIRGLVAQTGGNTEVFTYLKNGAASSLAATLNAAAGTSFVADITHELSFVAGDTLALRRSGPVVQLFEYTLEFEGVDANMAIYSYGGSGNDVMTNGPEYNSVFGGGGAWTADTQADIVAVPGSIVGISHNFSTAPGVAKSRSATIMLTGVAQDGTGGTHVGLVTVTNANTTTSGGYGSYATISVPIIAMNRLAVRYNSSGGPAVTGGGGVIAIQSSAANIWNLGGDSNQSGFIAGSNLYDRGAMLSSVDTVPQSSPAPLGPISITGVTWASNNAPGLAASGKSWTLEPYKNGSAVGSGATIFETATSGTATFAAVPLVDGDTFGIHAIASVIAPTNTGPFWWSLRAFDTATPLPPPILPIQRAGYVLFSDSIVEKQVETRLTKTYLQILVADPPAAVSPATLGLTEVVGNLYDQEGNVITFGRLTMTPRSPITVDGELIAPMTVTYDITGPVSINLAPSNGVLYDVQYDPTASDTVTPKNLKSGYFADVWDIPDAVSVDITDL